MRHIVSKGVGIDLGTTNSAVAVMNRTDSEILIHKDPQTRASTTPSCVWQGPKDAEPIVGRKAFARKGGTPEPVSSIKRLMGTRRTVEFAGEQLSPQRISSYILAEMKRQIEADVAKFDGGSSRWIVDRAVVTVPAYFDQPQIDATREAAEAAGLEVLDLLHEPTAAASYHCWRTATRDGTFLVYDLGGGTFDVSILRSTAGDFEVLGISGDTMLGGDDVDTALARHLQGMLQADGWDLDLDPERDAQDRIRFTRLTALAEGAKKELSRTSEFMLRDSGLLIDKSGSPVVIETLLERAELEEIARPLIEKTFQCCDQAIARATERAGISLADVDQVILAGGSTHMPLVRELVTRELCGQASPDSPRKARAKCEEPVYAEVDTVVALGAAVRAAAIGGLVVYDEDRSVKISLSGTGITGAARHTIGGRAEALVPAVDLAGGRVLLIAGAHEDEADLAEDGSFAFTRIPLQADAETEFAFEVFDANGDLRATAGRSLEQSTREVKPVGSTASDARNTKDIKLEVRRGEQTERTVLVPALELLPYSNHYEFRHPGGGVETIELRLFQESRPIQVLSVQVPASTPKDTPISMQVTMHRNYALTVEGSIGDAAYQADVDLPAERDMPTREETDGLFRRFEENVSVLSPGDRNTAQAQFSLAQRRFEDARDRGDTALATHVRDQMESIVDSLGRRETELRPAKPDFDFLVDRCSQLIAHYRKNGVPSGEAFDAAELSKTAEEHRIVGEEAYTNKDQRSYSEAVKQLDNLFTHLQGLGRAKDEDRPMLSTADRAAAALANLRGTARAVRFMAQNMQDAEAERQIAELQERASRLEAQIPVNPQHVLEEVGMLEAKLRQLNAILRSPVKGRRDTDIPEIGR